MLKHFVFKPFLFIILLVGISKEIPYFNFLEGNYKYQIKKPTLTFNDTANIKNNIVPNPGFELLDNHPLGWFYNGKQFNRVMKYWYSPTGASPDVYTPKVKVPRSWGENGFSKENPFKGTNMVGITVYGCNKGKPHCREYIEIQLSEPTVVGQNYHFEFWAKQLSKSLSTSNIGLLLSESRNFYLADERIICKPIFKIKTPLIAKTWQKISGNFVSAKEYSYLTIGNFDEDENTLVKASSESKPIGYYYIDEVIIKKEKPILRIEYGVNDILKQKMIQGNIYQLNEIYFESDSWELHPRSILELNKLYSILTSHSSMYIKIIGHTDNTGDEAYNQKLSQKRAEEIVHYLIKKGIRQDRLIAQGVGAKSNNFPNDNEFNRQKNRKVEFSIEKI